MRAFFLHFFALFGWSFSSGVIWWAKILEIPIF